MSEEMIIGQTDPCSLCGGAGRVRDNIDTLDYPETAPCPKCDDGEWAYRALIRRTAYTTRHGGRLLMRRMSAIESIAVERARQSDVEGWTPGHDDEHDDGSLAKAAAAYALSGSGHCANAAETWPWDRSWWKPKSPRDDLVRAGALIVAEIERLDREADDKSGVKE